ncbi:MAG TPA: tRNA (cytidine(34)-2'-O)-methyltransferase [Magnetospirillum sp.]|nr:tRNA (cytidine(34)-2'-O)-methyltransferase [Magnetospirillum sp.]
MNRPRLALYQPDIPQNAGAMLRLAACLSFGIDVIEPCGFLWDEKRMRRAGMDYVDLVGVTRHVSWTAFRQWTEDQGRRVVLLSTKASVRLDHFTFSPDDIIMVGRESAGVPDAVADAVGARVRIPLNPAARSLNVALAASIAMAEALRQLNAFPGEETP